MFITPPPVAWRPLFNERDLTGWKSQQPRSWLIADKILTGKANSIPERDVLTTEETFSDFELDIEFLTSTGCDSGLMLRMDKPVDPPVLGKLMEIQLGGIRATGLKTGCIISNNPKMIPVFPTVEFADDKWHQVHVRAVGQHLFVTIDGTMITDREAFAEDHQAGRIGLQLWSGTIAFRNLRVRELKPATKD